MAATSGLHSFFSSCRPHRQQPLSSYRHCRDSTALKNQWRVSWRWWPFCSSSPAFFPSTLANVLTEEPELEAAHGYPTGEPRGLNPEVIESFPTFLYATVKGLMIARETLACAVCLDEFKDEETLRLIPKCSHVFHPCCIDVWLESHSTCPVCRANLVPRSEDVPPFVAIQVPGDQEQQRNDAVGNDVECPKENLLHRSRTMNQNRTPRSRSTGFLFPRSNSTGHSVLVQPGENCERFTLRLPEEVRSQLLMNSTLKRTSSCVSFRRMSSGRKGYRTRSVGSGRGRNYFQCQYERFCSEGQWGFTLTPPFFTRNNWAKSARESPQLSAVVSDRVFGERSSGRISPGQPG